MKTATIKFKITDVCFKIYLEGLLHFLININDVIAVQSWIDDDRKLFIIEYKLTEGNGDITCEYRSEEIWKTILKKIDGEKMFEHY